MPPLEIRPAEGVEFPHLPKWQFNNLVESIRRYGVLVPIIRDADGNIIDGRQRWRACQILEIDCPAFTLPALSEAEKNDRRLVANLVRRHLSPRQRREIAKGVIKADPERSNNDIARATGLSPKTVDSVRTELRRSGEIDINIVARRGSDGKKYTRRSQTAILSANAREHEQAAELAKGTIPQSCSGRITPVKTVARRAKRAATALQAEEQPTAEPVTIDDIRLEHCRFQDLRIEPGTVDLVLTDPPYGGEFLPQLGDLAIFAERMLKPGGILAMHYGHRYLPDAMKALGERLTWQWLGSFAFPMGDAAIAWLPNGGQVMSRQTPVLIYTKGVPSLSVRITDAYISHSPNAEKTHHNWQKNADDVAHWLESLSEPGDLVCDPMLGGATTAVGCYRHDRRFVGCDCDARAIEIGRQRLDQVKAMPRQLEFDFGEPSGRPLVGPGAPEPEPEPKTKGRMLVLPTTR